MKARDNTVKIGLKPKKTGKNILILSVIAWFLVLILVPIYGIAKRTFTYGISIFLSSIFTPAARHSFLLTTLITVSAIVINTIFGVIALVLVKQDFKGKLFIEGLLDLPFAVSPVVAGFMFIILFGPKGWIGSWFEGYNIKIIYALPGMIIATLFVTLLFVAREVIPVLREFGLEEEEAAYVLGATKWQAFWKVTLPSIKWGLIYGTTLTVARSIEEFGAVLVVKCHSSFDAGKKNRFCVSTLRPFQAHDSRKKHILWPGNSKKEKE